MSTIEEFVNYYFDPESISVDISYESNRWIPWICAVFGAFVVGLSGIVPLLIMPETTSKTTSHKDVNYASSESQPPKTGDQKILNRTLSRQQSQLAQVEIVRKEQTLNRYLSFAVGGLLGDICLHLLPEIYSTKKDSSIIYDEDHQVRLGLSILAGILSFLAIEKLFDFTQDSAEEPNNNNETTIIGKSPKPVVGYLNLLANGIDNFVHGLAVSASFLTSFKLGALTAIAILIHEIPHEIGDFAILLRSGFSRWEAAKAQFCTATVGMMGAVAALLLDNGSAASQNNDNVSSFINTNLILAFSAGGFMHIAMVSILPDLIQEKNPKEAFIHFLLILLGISAMGIMSFI